VSPCGCNDVSDKNNLEFTGVVFVISAVTGFLGALTRLGGGVVITPALTLLMGVDLRYAIGASLVSVIATSSARRPPTFAKAFPTSASECFWRSPPPSGRLPAHTWQRVRLPLRWA
jgi:Sulfite exporter TauE/SafE